MCEPLLPLFGPFAIHAYGLAIVIGLVVFTLCLLADPVRRKLISSDQLGSAIIFCVLSALIGARLLYVLLNVQDLEHWWDIVAVHQGGFSLLGGVLGVLFGATIYLSYHRIAILPLFDRASIYAPLLQSISRIGCFFAGCCGGYTTALPWAVRIHNEGNALWVHPTQLYSSLALFGIFLIMYLLIRPRSWYPGQLFCWYLLLSNSERFIQDALRADRELLIGLWSLSVHQAIALVLIAGSLIGFGILKNVGTRYEPA